MRERKMQDWKIRHQMQGWKMRDWKMRDQETYGTPQVS